MSSFLRLGCAALLTGLACASYAQSAYPSQPIKVIVPFPPAGGTDVVARLVVDKVRAATGWTFVVDNKAGAGGNIGMDAVAKSKPDGYTLGMGQTANLAINPSLYSKMPFDAAKDFVPVALVAGQPVVLVVNAASPFKTAGRPGGRGESQASSVTMASAGNGTVGHLTGEMFAKQAGIKVNHIPYKGAGPAATDLLGGQVDFYFATPQSGGLLRQERQAARAGGEFGQAAAGAARRADGGRGRPTRDSTPPTGSCWSPRPARRRTIVKRLNAEVEKAMSKPETIAQLLAEGSIPLSGSAQQAAQYLKTEQQRWSAVVREANVKLD